MCCNRLRCCGRDSASGNRGDVVQSTGMHQHSPDRIPIPGIGGRDVIRYILQPLKRNTVASDRIVEFTGPGLSTFVQMRGLRPAT